MLIKLKGYFLVVIALLLTTTSVQGQGDDWEESNGPYGEPIEDLVVTGADIVIAASLEGIYRSDDYAGSWEKVNSSGTYQLGVRNDTLYAAAFSGVLRSIDGGQSWSVINSNSAYSLHVGESEIVAGGWYGRVFLSKDGGDSWDTINQDMVNRGYDQFVTAVVKKGEVILYSHFLDGIIQSTDLGEEWELTDLGRVPYFEVDDSGLIYTVFGGVWTSSDGVEWEKMSDFPASADIVITDDAVIGAAGGVNVSFDSGQTWEELDEGLERPETYAVAKDNQGFLYVGTECCVQRTISPIVEPTSIGNDDRLGHGTSVLNYPNPVRERTTFIINLDQATSLELLLYDIRGRELTTVLDRFLPSGTHEITWEMGDLSSGVYLYRLIGDNMVINGSILVTR